MANTWVMCYFILQAFSIIIAAYTTELGFTSSEPILPSAAICYVNYAALKSDHRICHNGVAAAVSSILICMMLLTFDAIIPCLNRSVSTKKCVE